MKIPIWCFQNFLKKCKNYIFKKLKNEKKNHIRSYRTYKYKMEYDNAIHMRKYYSKYI